MKPTRIPLLLLISFGGVASAQPVTWTGATDASWATTTNWAPAAPVAADTAVFDSNSTQNLSITLAAATTVAGISVNGPTGPVSLSGNFAFTAADVLVGSGSALSIENGTAGFTAGKLNGSGTLTIRKSSSVNWTTAGAIDVADDVNFNGSLVLRGGTATTVPGTAAGSWIAFGGASVSQAAGTAFSLDTGASATDAKDFIVPSGWVGKTIRLTSLSGYGSIRCDFGGAGTSTRTIRVDQADDTVFNGLYLSHHGTGNVIRNLDLVKAGDGTLTMAGIVGRQTASATGTSDLVGLTVEAGSLVLLADNTRNGAVSIQSGATLQVGNGGTTGLLGGGSVTNSGSLVIDRQGVAVFPNDISGAGGVLKRGSGTAVLSGALGYSGSTDVLGGLLRVSGALSSPFTLHSGGGIGTGTQAASGTATMHSLLLHEGSSSTFRVGGAGSDKITIDTTNGLVVAGMHTIRPVANGALATNDSFPVLDYTGTSPGLTNLQLPAGTRFQLVDNAANGSIDLVYTGGTLVWQGDNGSTWDIGSTPNWTLGETPSAFLQGDGVRFDDSADTTVVNLTEPMTPGSVTFENNSLPYLVTGASLDGTGVPLTKKGAAEATLAMPANYTGTTRVEAGILTIGDGTTNGEIGKGAVESIAGGTLRFNRTGVIDNKAVARMRNVSGDGDIVIDGGGTFFNYPGSGVGFHEAGSWNLFTGHLKVLDGSEFQTIRNGATAMGSATVVLGDESGSGSLSQIEGNWTWTNPIQVAGANNSILNRSSGGTDRWVKVQGAISGSGGLTFRDAAGSFSGSLEPGALGRGFILTGENTYAGMLTIDASAPVRIGGVPGENTAIDPGPNGSLGGAIVQNNGVLTFSRTDLHSVSSPISGAGAVVIGTSNILSDTQTVVFPDAQSYTGATIVRRGALRLDTGLPNSAVTVEAAGTVSGVGGINGNVTLSGTLSPGVAVGPFTVGGTATFNTGSRVKCEVADWDGIAGVGYDTAYVGSLVLQSTPANPVTVVLTPSSLVNFSETAKEFSLVITQSGVTGFVAGNVVVDDTAMPGNGTWTVQEDSGTLKLVYAPGSPDPFADWVATKGLTGNDALPGSDPDHDGISNLLEFVFGSEPNPANPASNSVASLPTMTLDATNFTFVFRRAPASASLNPVVQFGSALTGWTEASEGGGITIDEELNGFGGGIDKVTVVLPRTLAGSTGKLFARLFVQHP